MLKPPCFPTQEQFDEYMQALEETVDDPERSFCWDCLPEFKREMKAEGRCVYPLVQFEMVEGALVGKRPKE